MPIIEVHLLEGYEDSAQQRLAEALTDASRLVVPAPPEAITVMFHTMSVNEYYRGRTRRTPAPALPDPCVLVKQFLEHLGDRRLSDAKSMVSENFVMQFPGAAPMQDFGALVDWAASRYQSIEKQIESTEAFGAASGTTVVYCRGTLSGVWPDGSIFNAIRFVDRFELIDGFITRQEVWNDLAEIRAQAARDTL